MNTGLTAVFSLVYVVTDFWIFQDSCCCRNYYPDLERGVYCGQQPYADGIFPE